MVTWPNKSAISLPVLKGEKFCFSLTILRAFTFAFRLFFCHFPVIIVKILSFEQKLLLGIEYPVNELIRYSGTRQFMHLDNNN